jgi:C1A family cysteine protease
MHRLIFWKSLVVAPLVVVLVACPPKTTPSAPDPLTEPNAWKAPIPADAEQVSPDEFRRRVASGELTISSAASIEATKKAQEAQFTKDKATIESAASSSPYFQALAEEARTRTTFEGDRPVVTPGGATVLFGLGTELRNAADAYALSQSADNALTNYTQLYNLLPDGIKPSAATPDSLKGKSLGEVQVALANLNTLLAGVTKLDKTRLETASSQSGKISPQAVNPGNGTDNNGVCNPQQLQKRYWFPLKSFVSPIKNQANRGTCWAFTAIGALESRERVQNNNPADLSEQFLVNKVKQDWDSSDDTDGFSPARALNTASDKGQVFPSEGSWTYNPSMSRPYPAYDNSCNNYTGTCSDTAHQSRRTCTTFIFKFCSYVKVTYSDAGVSPSRAYNVWTNGQTWNLNNIRLLLSQGHVLIATFPVYKGFMDDAANGFVTNYAMTYLDKDGKEKSGSYGAHAVQVVGFLDNDTLSTINNRSNVGGGGYFIVKNSWGCGAGDGGYFYVPADYVSGLFSSLDALDFDNRRSDAWNKEQAAPGGSDAPKTTVKANPATANLRVEVDLAAFFAVSHPVAKSVNLSVTSNKDGAIYNGSWNTDSNALFGSSLKYTFGTPGTRTLTLTAKYGSSQSSASFIVNAVNTPPSLRLSYAGDPAQGEDYPISALITDINEPNASTLCANTTWAVDAPDTLSSAPSCQVKVKFGATGVRQVRVSTTDTEGVSTSQTLSLNVQPPPVNPYPRIIGATLLSQEVVKLGNLNLCGDPVVVNNGSTIDLRDSACVVAPITAPPRYKMVPQVDNSFGDAVTYDWDLYVTENAGERRLYGVTDSYSFVLGPGGNYSPVTFDCRVTLKVNALDPTRSKGPVTVWNGKCTYYAGSLH